MHGRAAQVQAEVGNGADWDAKGNLVDNGTYKLKYNYKNLIVEVRLKSDNSLVATYKYDAEGRRAEKDVGGDVERYIRSRVSGTVSHIVAVYDGSNNWLQNFVWSDEVDGIEVLEQKDVLDYDTDGNTTEITRSYYHRNALGSVMEITDANETIAVSYRYDPYGKVTITRNGQTQSADPLGQHWVFTGRFLDEESDLLYYRARYYDPGLGRFLQRDPLGVAVAPNAYEYADSSPIEFRDPEGFQPTKHPTVKGTPGRSLRNGATRKFQFGTTDGKKGLWIRQVWTLKGTVWDEKGNRQRVDEKTTEYFKIGASVHSTATTGTDTHYFLYSKRWCGGRLTFTSTLTVGTLKDKKGRTNSYFLGSSTTKIKPPSGPAKHPQGDRIEFEPDGDYAKLVYTYTFSWDYCPRPSIPSPPGTPTPRDPVITPGEWWIPSTSKQERRTYAPAKRRIPRW